MVTAGPYRAVRLLERCSGASVYLGEGHGREVLLFVREEALLDRETFLASLAALRQLPEGFPAARVLDGGIDDRGAWVASERLAGRTWADAWAHRRARPVTTAPLLPFLVIREVLDLLEVLEAAHRRGVVHGGLSPHGFLTRPDDGQRMIAHFGVSWLLRTPLVVSPRYRAPEHFGEPVALDVSTDVYGAGLLLYRLLSGVEPYEGADAAALRDCVMSVPLARSIAVPTTIARIIERATAKRPADRYPTVTALREALMQVVEATPGVDPTSSGTRAVSLHRAAAGSQPPDSPEAITLRSPAPPEALTPEPAATEASVTETPPADGAVLALSAATAADSGVSGAAPVQGEDTEAEPVTLVRQPAALPAAPPPAPERAAGRSAATPLAIVALAAAVLALLAGGVALVRGEARPTLAARLPVHWFHLVEVPRPAPMQTASPTPEPQVIAPRPPRSAPARQAAPAPVAGSSAIPAAVPVVPSTDPSPSASPAAPLPSGQPGNFLGQIEDPCALSWYRCAREFEVRGGRSSR